VKQTTPHISVIIVNYKVKEYIANLLSSLKKASHSFILEIFVVDNDSDDGSVSYLKERFPEVRYIENSKNIGFGRANNQVIAKARGEYTLIINPDTLVSEDTLKCLVNHMEENPGCGAAGCKILNPDGTFAPESRRTVPTIGSAFGKVFGLNTLFPKSKLFGKYYMNWLDENEASEVDVLSGSFMFWRSSLLKDLNGFDERFFMYGEDIDLCYRVQDTDYHIDYVPDTSIIHYKGESTKKGDLKYIRIFNKALYQFFDKHYSSRYSSFFRVFIYLAIWIKTIFSIALSSFRKLKAVLIDLFILNLSIITGFILRYALKGENIVNPVGIKYLWITALGSLLYLFSGSLVGLFKQKKRTLSANFKALSMTYAGVVIITFFVRNLAYTRLGLILGFLFGVLFFVSYTMLRANRSGSSKTQRGQIRNAKVLIVGDPEKTDDLISKIHRRPDWIYEVTGKVAVKEVPTHENVIGGISQLQDLIKAYNIDQVFFALHSISYKQMLKEISGLQKEGVVFKLIPDSMDFILGKSNVEYLESIPLVEVDIDYEKPINKFLKRALDLFISIPVTLVMGLIVGPAMLLNKSELSEISGIKLYTNAIRHAWKNRLRLLGYVVSGKLSLVGSPIYRPKLTTSFQAKPGLTGLVQISDNRISGDEDAESYTLYYIQNYSIWMDMDILVKSLFNDTSLLTKIEKALKTRSSVPVG
jgi:GT2 family glycosyltransferase/lipopolysaccharide/colanic/teichoic acid biosynthesis glycosyltransferase